MVREDLEDMKLEPILRRPELVVHDVVRHLEKTRSFRAFITTQTVLKSVHARLKKSTNIDYPEETVMHALLQAECDGMIYRVHGIRRPETHYFMSREHQKLHGCCGYSIVPFNNPEYQSAHLRNLVFQVLSDYGPKYATEIHRIIQEYKNKFLNCDLEYFRKVVMPNTLSNPERSWIKLDSGKYSIQKREPEIRSKNIATRHKKRAHRESGQSSDRNDSKPVLKKTDISNTIQEVPEYAEDEEKLPKNRTYRLPSNHQRNTRADFIESFNWEQRTAHYIKDDFISYLHEELQYQLCKTSNLDSVYNMFLLPCTVEKWDHHHTRCYLTGIGYPELAERFFHYETKGIDLLLLTREEIVSSLNLPLGRSLKLAALIKRLHDAKR